MPRTARRSRPAAMARSIIEKTANREVDGEEPVFDQQLV
jgi:hypothetical protein